MAPTHRQSENPEKKIQATAQGTQAVAPDKKENKSWATWLAAGALIVALFAWLQPQYSSHEQNDLDSLVDGRIDAKLQEPNRKLDQIGNELAEIKGTLKAWAPFMTPQFFKKTVSLPDKQFGESLPQLRVITQIASESKTEVPAKDVSDVGKRTIALASANSEVGKLAWETTTSLLQYRSVLNDGSAPRPPGQRPLPGQWAANYEFTTGPPIPQEGHVTMAGLVARENAALAEPIGRSLLPSSISLAPAFLILDSVSVSLDGYRLKNVIFRNSKIKYDGGPLRMENVYFVNCTFEVPPNQHGREFAQKVIAGVATSADIG